MSTETHRAYDAGFLRSTRCASIAATILSWYAIWKLTASRCASAA